MLYLIGLGLNDETDLTLKGLYAAKKSVCFIETYTNHWHGSLLKLKEIVGKDVIELQRSDLEENSSELLEKAKEHDVAILVPGDPLAATTHANLIIDAKKAGVEYKIIHNSSIFSAIGELGLQLYKFGKTATIPFSGHISSAKNAILANKSVGLHTLLLLDVDKANDKYMSVREGLKMVFDSKAVLGGDKIIVASKIGSENPEIVMDEVSNILKREISTPAVIIVPYFPVHSQEDEFLKILDKK